MKLVVQIPCLNEADTLGAVVASIPRQIAGVDRVEILVIDDGSTDGTADLARALGVEHVVSNRGTKGLAASFAVGLHEALRLGADIIVNTDGDNQYPQEAIPALIEPILLGTHDIVVGDRQPATIAHFSAAKKLLQRFGTRVVQRAGSTDVPDAASGFRAYSREAAMALNVVTDFSYAMETIISAGRRRFAITHLPITTNAKTRESRLFSSTAQHVRKSAAAIVRSYSMYRSFQVFLATGALFLIVGIAPYVRFLYWFVTGSPEVGGHVQSLIFGAVLSMFGVLLLVVGVLADLISVNRRLLEDLLMRVKRLEYDGDDGPGPGDVDRHRRAGPGQERRVR